MILILNPLKCSPTDHYNIIWLQFYSRNYIYEFIIWLFWSTFPSSIYEIINSYIYVYIYIKGFTYPYSFCRDYIRSGTTGNPFLELKVLCTKKQPATVKVIRSKEATQVKIISGITGWWGEKVKIYSNDLHILMHTPPWTWTHPAKSNQFRSLPLLNYESSWSRSCR